MNWQPAFAELAIAHGAPLLSARFKQSPADFRVDEELGFEPDGSGEHELLLVEKTGLTTPEAQQALSSAFGLPLQKISYAGLKDKHAVTSQWFSLHSHQDCEQRKELPAGIRVLQRVRNRRKLQRGSHRGNRFVVTLRDCRELPATSVWQQRLQHIERDGVPNYFGPQRFGFGGGNLNQAARWFAAETQMPQRNQRSMLLSAARSFIFNAVLSERVAQASWNHILAGEVLALAGSSATFAGSRATPEELQERLDQFDIHPTGPLWGEGSLVSTGNVAAMETAIASRYPQFTAGLIQHGLRQERRPLRVQVADLAATVQDGVMTLDFRLTRGAYATAVLRELVQMEDA